ncbi:unnamed protein product, partial [Rotaria sordida]
KRPIAPSTSKLISSNDKNLDIHLVDYYIRRWLDLSAYITCFHSTNFYNKDSLSQNLFQENTIPFYSSYMDTDLYTDLNTGLMSIKINTKFPFRTDEKGQFGKYGECYYCCLLRKDEIIDKSDMPLKKCVKSVGDYATSIFYFELYQNEKNANDDHLLLDDNFFLKFNGLEIIDITNIIIDRFRLSNHNLYCLQNLSYLSLKNNDLSRIAVDFKYLYRLNYLKLIENPLKSLPKNCFSPKSLETVELCKLGQLVDIDSNAEFSSQLKILLITESILTTLPYTLSTCGLNKLKKFALNGVPWWGATGLSVNEIIEYDSFRRRFEIYVDDDELKKIHHMYDIDLNGYLSYSEINLMNAHMYRYIPRSAPNISSVEPTDSNDSNSLRQEPLLNDLSGIPSVIFQLDSLTEFSLEYQGIKFIPDAIKNLKNLLKLNLNYCIELETLSAYVGCLSLQELNLNGCVSLKTPPIEITRRGHIETMAFLKRLLSGSTSCKRTKLMLVGLGGAGKTSLVRAFLKSYSDTPPTVTDGIDIVKWRVSLVEQNNYLEFSVWDFAGQSVYYHTHQFFLAKQAIYVVAWNMRLGAEHAGLDFWLSSIRCHAPNAPIFVVGTHIDLVIRADLREEDLQRRFPQIVGFFNVSTTKGDNLNELIETIIKTALKLPHMDKLIPKAWLNFEISISKCHHHILKYDEVIKIARQSGIFDLSEVLQSVQFLHDLGSLQYFSSEHLKNYVVVNPQWIIDVMACIVSINNYRVNDGRLFHSDISDIWKKYPSDLHAWILKLTEAFDLTCAVPNQGMNLVPCLLPEKEPQHIWNDENDDRLREMKITYTFDYLPGMLCRYQRHLGIYKLDSETSTS